jgi:hypothetical protein
VCCDKNDLAVSGRANQDYWGTSFEFRDKNSICCPYPQEYKMEFPWENRGEMGCCPYEETYQGAANGRQCCADDPNSQHCCEKAGGLWESINENDGVCCDANRKGYLWGSETTDYEHCGCPVDSQGREGSWRTDYDPNGACCESGYAYSSKTGAYDKVDKNSCGCPVGPEGSMEPYSDVPSECAEEVCCARAGWAYVSGKRDTTEPKIEPNTLSCGCGDDADYYTRCGYHANPSSWINTSTCVRDCCAFSESYNGRSECCYDESTGCHSYDTEVCCKGAYPNYNWNSKTSKCCNGMTNVATGEYDIDCCPWTLTTLNGSEICCESDGTEHNSSGSSLSLACCMAMGSTTSECCTEWKNNGWWFSSLENVKSEWNTMADQCCEHSENGMGSTYTDSYGNKYCCDDNSNNGGSSDYGYQCCSSYYGAYAESGGRKQCCTDATMNQPEC